MKARAINNIAAIARSYCTNLPDIFKVSRHRESHKSCAARV
jgi:hypothetical protein